jgi:hypothetical protein
MLMDQKKKAAFVALLCLIMTVGVVSGAALPEKKTVTIPRLSKSPKIDGIKDNPLWEKEALKIEDFYQLAPKEMGEPSEKTTAYIGYDSKNLYFAFDCFDSEPDKIWASITARDRCIEDDWIAIFLDTFNEKRRAFSFIINPLGIQMDCIRMEEGGSDNMDDSWDTAFISEGKINDQGYFLEISIPFKSLRFPDEDNKIWGVVLGRNIPRKGEVLLWPSFSREIPGLISQGGEFLLQGDVEKGKNFELMPVATSLKTKGESIDFQPGVNFKWGISSDLTMDLTVNPDFSHIEADAPQIDINRRFALYYPEKRPFFLEGMEIFTFPEIDLVYTRRIIDPLAGAKFTGKAGRFTYGILSSLDDSPSNNLWNVSEGGEGGTDNALFNIVRVKADVFKNSYIGFSLTDKTTGGLYNRVAGVDGQLKFKNKFFISFQAVASQTKYEDRKTDVAPALYGEFRYFSKHLGAGLFYQSHHPDFEALSGFVNRVDYKLGGAFAYLSVYPQKKYLNQLNFEINGGKRFTYFNDVLEDQWAEFNIHIRMTEFNMVNLEYRRQMERYSNINFDRNEFSLSGDFTLVSWLPFGLYFETGESIYYDPDDPYLGWSNVYGLYFSIKPNKRLRLSTNFSKQTFWKEWGGEQVFDYNVIRQMATYQISKTLALRAIVDYNHFYKEVYGSFLLSYVYRPGTVFFFGVDNDLLRDEFGKYRGKSYSVFVKFSYWWRI